MVSGHTLKLGSVYFTQFRTGNVWWRLCGPASHWLWASSSPLCFCFLFLFLFCIYPQYLFYFFKYLYFFHYSSVIFLNFLNDFYFFYHGWFTVFCQFLLYSKVTQSYIYIFFFSHYPTSYSITGDQMNSLCHTAGKKFNFRYLMSMESYTVFVFLWLIFFI